MNYCQKSHPLQLRWGKTLKFYLTHSALVAPLLIKKTAISFVLQLLLSDLILKASTGSNIFRIL